MKIYTKTGDLGQTKLLGGTEVPKSDLRLEAYGTVDELNSWLGLIRSELTQKQSSSFDLAFREIQNQLFVVGSHLACEDEGFKKHLPLFDPKHIQTLETNIDQMTAQLSELKNFILPGSHKVASQLHIARTVCRRAERIISALNLEQKIAPEFIIYINRLSDYLFVCARFANHLEGCKDELWQK